MHGLGAGVGIGVLTLTLISVSFSGAGQTGPAPAKVKAVQPVAAPRTVFAKHKAFAPAPRPAEEQAQLPSDQAVTRAWFQDAARQEPIPDERTLQMQLKESKRLQQEKNRIELKQDPQTPETPRASAGLSVAEDVPAKSIPAAPDSKR